MSELDFVDNEEDKSSENGVVSDVGIVAIMEDEERQTPGLLSFDAHDHLQSGLPSTESRLTFHSLPLSPSQTSIKLVNGLLCSSIKIQAYLRGRFTQSDQATLSSTHPDDAVNRANGIDDKDTIGLIFYRRNKFKVVGTISLPATITSTIYGRSRVPQISGVYAELDAIESLEGANVRLIHSTAKSKINSAASQQELPVDQTRQISTPRTAHGPPRVCLWQDKIDHNGKSSSKVTEENPEISVPISWEKLQFRHATAKKRGTWQYFYLRVTVIAMLKDGTSHAISRSQSSAITVRGRSPQSFPTHASKTKRMGALGMGRGQHAVTRAHDGLNETQWNNSTLNTQSTDFDSRLNAASNDLLFYDFSDLGIWDSDLQLQVGDEEATGLNTMNEYFERGSTANTSTKETQNISHTDSLLIPPSETQLLPNIPNLGSIFNLPDSFSSSSTKYPHPFHTPGENLASFASLPLHDGIGTGSPAPILAANIEISDRGITPPQNVHAMGEDSDTTDDERKTYSYEYIPLSINDWTVPVDAVYRPHGVHARKVPDVERSIMKKRYFLSVR